MKRQARKKLKTYAASGVRMYAAMQSVEIFATGTHNGDTYTAADLDAMAEAASQLDFQPALKIGHGNDTGSEAYGYLTNIRREGAKLLGDITDIPDALYKKIQDKRFNRLSAEIAWNFERAGKTFKRVLMAVALLGAGVPGVAGLKPLHAAFAECKAEVKWYDRDPIQIDSQQGEHDMTQAEIDAAIAAAAKKVEDKLRLEYEERERVRTKEYSEQRTRDQAAFAQLAATQRQTGIDAIADKCKVPALRPMLKAFADMALAIVPGADGKLRTYALDADKLKAAEPLAVVEAMVAYVNEQAGKLFKLHSVKDGKDANGNVIDRDHDAENTDVPVAHEDIAGEVDKLTKAHIAANPTVKYSAAMQVVLHDPKNAEIAEAYRVAQGGKPKAA